MNRVVPAKLVNLFVKTWNKHHPGNRVSKHEINWGWCYQMAIVLKRANVGAKLCTDSSHAWIKIGDTYYDSDHPKGVKDWFIISNYEDSYEILSEKRLAQHWVDHEGLSGPVDYKVINEVLKKWKEMCS